MYTACKYITKCSVNNEYWSLDTYVQTEIVKLLPGTNSLRISS